MASTTRDLAFGMSRFAFLATGILGLWIVSSFVVVWMIPEWEDRARFGDMFGAVNSLFSGLALAGVVYALLLQRSELALQRSEQEQTRESFQAQLREMEAARQVQTQPLALCGKVTLQVQKPRVFYTPPEDRYSALARIFATIELNNPSGTPAIGVLLSAQIGRQATGEVLHATDQFVAVLPADGSSRIEKPSLSFMFKPPDVALLETWAKGTDPWLSPTLHVQAYFRNLSGGHFRSRTTFMLTNSEARSERLLMRWAEHLGVFGEHLQAHLAALPGPGSRRSWGHWFNELKAGYGAGLAADPDEVALHVAMVTHRFEVSVVPECEYRTALDTARFGTLTDGRAACPFVAKERGGEKVGRSLSLRIVPVDE